MPAPRSNTRSIAAVCALSIAAVAGCQRSNDWNDSFQRSEGWWYSDGAVSAELPGGKTVWLFGDTLLRDNGGVFANSMAFQDTPPGQAPARNQMRFFVRGERGELLDVSRVGEHARKAWALAPSVNGDSGNKWLWPTSALVSGGKLVASYVEMGCSVADFAACRGYMGNMTIAGHTLVQVDNPADPPEQWSIQAKPLVDRNGRPAFAERLHWGSALYEDGGWLYVFGNTFGPKLRPEDVKLARTVPDDAARYDRWQFLTPHGWRMLPTGATPVELQTIARGGATELSVHRVVRRGQAWLLMVQLDLVAQEVVVRSSPAVEIQAVLWEGPEAGKRVRRFSLPALDPDTAGAPSWSVRTHLHHSSPDKSLLVSFYSGKTASLRFVELPMSSLLD
jgi:hypothetical protein